MRDTGLTTAAIMKELRFDNGDFGLYNAKFERDNDEVKAGERWVDNQIMARLTIGRSDSLAKIEGLAQGPVDPGEAAFSRPQEADRNLSVIRLWRSSIGNRGSLLKEAELYKTTEPTSIIPRSSTQLPSISM